MRFQYTDWTVWDSSPQDAALSPDKGVVRMYALDDFGNTLEFVYEDFYYLYPTKGGWCFGSGTPKRDFILRPGEHGSEARMIPFTLPKGAVVRHGETVSQEEAVRFGLIGSVDEKQLHPKRTVPIEYKGCG